MQYKSLLLSLSSMLFISTAMAGNTGFSALGALGVSHMDCDMGPIVSGEIYRHKDSLNLGLKLGFGYRFNDYFSLEGAYTYLGKAKYSTIGLGSAPKPTQNLGITHIGWV